MFLKQTVVSQVQITWDNVFGNFVNKISMCIPQKSLKIDIDASSTALTSYISPCSFNLSENKVKRPLPSACPDATQFPWLVSVGFLGSCLVHRSNVTAVLQQQFAMVLPFSWTEHQESGSDLLFISGILCQQQTVTYTTTLG